MAKSIENTLGSGRMGPQSGTAEMALEPERIFDFKEVSKHPLFLPSVVLLVGLCAAFFSLWLVSYEEWVAPDSLYSHGPLIPFLAAYAVWIRWPKMKDIPVKPVVWAALPLIPIMYVTWIAERTEMKQTQSGMFLLAAFFAIWFVAGRRWAFAFVPIILFTSFCFPMWSEVIDHYTLSMQHLSAQMAVTFLQLVGLHPFKADATTVYLDHFTLDVEAACSGAKLTLALSAFTAFFMLTRTAKVWANVVLVAILFPFCLLINGLRIAMVGIVGNQFGADTGKAFHDYGGYIALVICFVLLSSITKALGYK